MVPTRFLLTPMNRKVLRYLLRSLGVLSHRFNRWALIKDPTLAPANIIAKIDLQRVDEGEVTAMIEKVIREQIGFVREQKLDAVGPLMGVIMKKPVGKLEGKQVSNLLRQQIQKVLKKGKK